MKAKIKAMQMAASKVMGRKLLIIKKYSPEILMVTGVVGIVAGTVVACRATLKAEAVVDVAKEKLDKIKQAKELADSGAAINYTEHDHRRDLTVAYVQTGVDFVKLYAPATFLLVGGIACVLSAHGIMRQRNLALMAAYKAIDESFKTYRGRVVEEYGKEKDHQFKTGYKQEIENAIGVDADGKKIKIKETHDVLDPNLISEYARFYDESCREWERNAEYNLYRLKCHQNYANDLLQSRGHVFLNEVYEMLGIPHTNAGSVVGWVKGHGDDRIDFGIFDGKKPMVREFVNGYENSILLDFNVDGVIYGLL